MNNFGAISLALSVIFSVTPVWAETQLGSEFSPLPGRVQYTEAVPASVQTSASTMLPTGLAFQAALTSPLNSKESLVGDQFQLLLQEDLISPDGLGMIPAGSVINAKVQEIQEAQLARIKAKMAISFYQITTPDGQVIPIDASVDSETGYLKGNKRKGKLVNFAVNQAVKTGVRLAAGAAAGYGAGIVLFTIARRGKEVILAEGDTIPIRLNQAVYFTAITPPPTQADPNSTAGFIPVSHSELMFPESK